MYNEEIKNIDRQNPLEVLEKLRNMCKAPFMLADQDYVYLSAEPFDTININGLSKDESFEKLKVKLKAHSINDKGAFPFNSGAVGSIDYDLNGIDCRDNNNSNITFNLYDPIIVINKKTGVGTFQSYKTKGYQVRLKKLKTALNSSEPKSKKNELVLSDLKESTSKDEYIKQIKKAKEYIRSGDIYQINISINFTCSIKGDGSNIYKSLFNNSPSRFCYYIETHEKTIIANTPERFLSLSENTLTTEPIKGTAPRGESIEDDKAIIKALKENPKEQAEHVMIVDLERNDLSIISKKSSVKVTDFKRIETYPSLFHMTSTIKSTLKDTLNNIDAIKEIFPGGSITGAPKKRSMEIINELEQRSRGLYSGALGWIDLSGDFDLAMAIRTAVIEDDTLNFSLGSGIVIDSKEEAEYNETMLKGSDFLKLVSDNK